MRPMTVSEIAQRLGVERDAAYNLVRFLLAVQFATLKGVRKPEKGPGKGENVYAFEEGAGERVAAMIEKRIMG